MRWDRKRVSYLLSDAVAHLIGSFPSSTSSSSSSLFFFFSFLPPFSFPNERTKQNARKGKGKNQRWNVQPHRHLPFSRPACVKEKELVSLTIPIFNLNTQSIYINIRIRFFFCCCFVFRSNSGRWTWRRIIKRADERVHTQNVQPFFGCGTVH